MVGAKPARKRSRLLVVVSVTSLIGFALSWLSAGFLAVASDTSALWVAESRGVLSLSQADGVAEFEVAANPDARAIAVDGQHKTLWVFSGQVLRSYDLSGALKSTTPLSPPEGNPAILTVDPQARRIWLAVQSQVYLLDDAGQLLKQFRLPQPVTDISLDRRKSRLWLAYKNTLLIYDQEGNQITQIGAQDLKVIRALDYDIKHNQIWVAADDTLRRYTPEGTVAFTAQNSWFNDIQFIAADQQGGLWAASARQLASLNVSGGVSFLVTPFAGASPDFVVDLIADPKNHSVWVASPQRLSHFGIDSQGLADFTPSLPDGKSRLVRQLALEVAPIAPQIQFTAPAGNSVLNNAKPTLQVSYAGEDIDLNSLRFATNATVIATTCSSHASAANCTPVRPLADGAYDITATIANSAGNISQPALTHVTIDTLAPTITVISPADGFLTNRNTLQITGSVSEPVSLTINGILVSVSANQYSFGPRTLVEGPNSFQFRATDLAGNVGAKAISIILDAVPPPAPTGGLIQTQSSQGQVTVTGKPGSVEGGSRVTVINTTTGDRITVTANADGSFSAALSGSPGDALQVYTNDVAGNQSAATSVDVASGGPFSGAIKFGAISPASGSTVDGDFVLVSVDLQAPPNTGVTINDVVAAATPGPAGLRYYAMVPIQVGQNSLTITAHSQDGRSVDRALSIASRGPWPYRITPIPGTGISPLQTELRVEDVRGLGVRQVQVDFNSDGTTDLVVPDAFTSITATYSGAGLRQARVTVFDGAGVGHVQTVPLLLLDPNQIDREVQAVWNGMNAALASGDKATALQFLSGDAAETYSPVFDALIPRMPAIISSYSLLQRSFITDTYVEYGINRTIDGVNRVFLIGFVTNEYGQWRVSSM